jgi:phospholipid-binding lipoprotein MlaA
MRLAGSRPACPATGHDIHFGSRCWREGSAGCVTTAPFFGGKVLFSGVVLWWPPQLLRTALGIIGLSFFLAACAATPQTAVHRPAEPADTQVAQIGSDAWSDSESDDIYEDFDDDNDPLEVPNRMFFAFNEALDFMVIRPVAVTYSYVVPLGVRNTVRNFLRNLRSPVTLANDLLQGNLERAEVTFTRFFINSTIGMLGLFDIAADSGFPYHTEDFGQTMGSYGAGEGFYLVLPVLGPSSLRDGTGRIVDLFLDPLTYLAPQEFNLGSSATEGVDTRSRNIDELDQLKADSLDFYARIRSLYRQYRENEISNGALPAGTPGFTEVPAQSTSSLE